jgi:hypothetical protein
MSLVKMSFRYDPSCKNVLQLRFESFPIKCDCNPDDAIILDKNLVILNVKNWLSYFDISMIIECDNTNVKCFQHFWKN